MFVKVKRRCFTRGLFMGFEVYYFYLAESYRDPLNRKKVKQRHLGYIGNWHPIKPVENFIKEVRNRLPDDVHLGQIIDSLKKKLLTPIPADIEASIKEDYARLQRPPTPGSLAALYQAREEARAVHKEPETETPLPASSQEKGPASKPGGLDWSRPYANCKEGYGPEWYEQDGKRFNLKGEPLDG